MSATSASSRIHGCLVGAVVGEASALAGLAGAHGRGTGLEPGPGPLGLGPAGQLTLFTADGLLEAIEWANDGVHADEAACVWLASLRWVSGQGIPLSPSAPAAQPRWLDSQEGVRVPAAAQPAWVASLARGEMGSTARPLGLEFDDAGAAAHAAPFGLVPHIPAAGVLKMSAEGAALTHGAPVAVQSAVAVASVTHFLALGADALTALGSARAQVASLRSPDAKVLEALDAAVREGVAGDAAAAHDGDASVALRAAAAAVLAAESAVQSGDRHDAAFATGVGLAAAAGSDAAAIAGALLGTLWGRDSVTDAWSSRTAGVAAADGLADRFARLTGA
ncbi:ADP-ribosylglycohydrolase family protein [Sinomonas flava]|uniref:ADP-ribosylglycohydrolase family protein n=1 Tax=Sinomonas flava TaxID=496857 RepID=UPI0039A6F39D